MTYAYRTSPDARLWDEYMAANRKARDTYRAEQNAPELAAERKRQLQRAADQRRYRDRQRAKKEQQ